jgi:DNA-3-methyladenine glycosylase I
MKKDETGTDVVRCDWCGQDPLYVDYHDNEWGRPLHDDRLLFEHICLEGFQCGLSWIQILRKRENFRSAFHDFEIARVAAMSERDVERLLKNAGIIRNQQKIRAAINNANCALELIDQHGSLDTFLWSFAPKAPVQRPQSLEQVRARSSESETFSRALRELRWKFVGPVGIYAFMQSVGMVDDHVEGCFRAKNTVED